MKQELKLIEQGLLLRKQGLFSDAIKAYQQALSVNPGSTLAYYKLATCYMMINERAAAIEALKKALALSPNDLMLNRFLIESSNVQSYPEDKIVILENRLQKDNIPEKDYVNICFMLGKIYNDKEQYAKAWQYYTKANNALAKNKNFDIVNARKTVKSVFNVFNQDFFKLNRYQPIDCRQPIFIIGMPRSGKTTLESWLKNTGCFIVGSEITDLEKIFTTAQKQYSLSESYPKWAKTASNDILDNIAQAYIDKLNKVSASDLPVMNTYPGNIYHLGMICLLFPKAKIIHMQRDKNDLILQNYFRYFGAGHEYAYKVEWLEDFYELMNDFILRWKQVLPIRIHTVKFEKLIENPQAELSQILGYLGVDSPISIKINKPLDPNINQFQHYAKFYKPKSS